MKIKTIKDIKELKGKRIVLRVDFNVPMKDDEIQDDTRIKATLKTILYLKENGAKTIIITHMGRPKGEVVEELKLDKISQRLSKLLNTEVKKIKDLDIDKIKKQTENLNEGEIVMLENIRFWKEEKKCDSNFSKQLGELGDLFINDAFAVSHREHASIYGITKHLDAYGGFLLEKEIEALSPIIESEPAKPVTMIIGGAKIDTKIGIIKKFLNKVDNFLIGGALANTFLSAAGYNIGKSLSEEDKIEMAREIMMECEKHHEKFIIPHDVVVASEIKENAESVNIPIEDVIGDMMILDIGKWTAEKYANIIEKSSTVIWNGPLGLCEYTPFQGGTRTVGETLSKHNCTSIIGGGDTIDCLKRIGIPEKSFSHVSTGGGACIEFLEGKDLPGIKPLLR